MVENGREWRPSCPHNRSAINKKEIRAEARDCGLRSKTAGSETKVSLLLALLLLPVGAENGSSSGGRRAKMLELRTQTCAHSRPSLSLALRLRTANLEPAHQEPSTKKQEVRTEQHIAHSQERRTYLATSILSVHTWQPARQVRDARSRFATSSYLVLQAFSVSSSDILFSCRVRNRNSTCSRRHAHACDTFSSCAYRLHPSSRCA